MKEVLVVMTSPFKKGRNCDSEERRLLEWEGCWELSSDVLWIKITRTSLNEITNCSNFEESLSSLDEERTIFVFNSLGILKKCETSEYLSSALENINGIDREQRQKIINYYQNFVQKIVNSIHKDNIRIYLLTHESVSISSGENTYIRTYSLGKRAQAWSKLRLIKDYIKNSKGNFNDIFSDVVMFFFNPLTLLIHRMAHLFLPMDIDLMGISEVEESKKVRYLKEVLSDSDKDKNYYKRKLLDLAFYVAKIGSVTVNGSTLQSNIKEDDLPGGKSLKEIVEDLKRREQNEQQKEKVNEILKKIYTLTGIKENGLEIDTNSKIFEFMKLLDEKTQKNNIQLSDVHEILNFFQKNGCWAVDNKKICSFHQWFCELVKKIKSLIKTSEEDKS